MIGFHQSNSSSLFVPIPGTTFTQEPNPNRDTQEQDSQVDRVEPRFDYLFHRIFSFLIFAKCMVQQDELTSPSAGERLGDFS
jgi:hypothetical protein